MVGAFIEGMHRGEVAATIKHFPGIGRITGNTDLTAEGITDRTTTASDPYLRPFGAGIKAGADFVMVGSAIYSRIDPGVNATFSKAIITDLLRHQLGYDGVVITDDVGAAKAVAATPVGQRATKFVDAGGDIVLTARPDTVPTMHRALTSRMSADRAFAAKVTASATRVMALKVQAGLAVRVTPRRAASVDGSIEEWLDRSRRIGPDAGRRLRTGQAPLASTSRSADRGRSAHGPWPPSAPRAPRPSRRCPCTAPASGRAG